MKQKSGSHANYWHTLSENKIQCDLCPHYCQLKPGQRGLCYVRGNEEGEMRLHTWGRSSGFCIDPVEKKPLNHFYPGEPILSFGTAGCNLTCKFCQNWDMSKSRQMETLASEATPEQIAAAADQHHCMGVAYTYNDPVIFSEYAIDTAHACHERGIKSVAVSAGYICEKPRKDFFAVMDAANIDLKSFDQTFYKQLCGGQLSTVLDTLIYIKHETNCWLEITTLLIPDKNDSNNELEQLCRWIADNLGQDTPIHFSAFHPDYKMLDIPVTPAETLTRAREIALSNGLYYPYTGNVHDQLGSSTYCPSCNNLLIERDWYQLGHWGLTDEGSCKRCNTKLAGVFNPKPGRWGAKRQMVRIS